MKLPDPLTFAEGQRALALWAMIAGGIFNGLGTVGVILLFWLGHWSDRSEHERIMWIALIGISYAIGNISVLVSCAVGGPVGRFKMDASRSGVGFDLSGDQTAATVTTTTAVSTPAQPVPTKEGQ